MQMANDLGIAPARPILRCKCVQVCPVLKKNWSRAALQIVRQKAGQHLAMSADWPSRYNPTAGGFLAAS